MGEFLATHDPAHGQENRSAAALPTDPLSHRHECAGMDQPLPSRGKEVISAELIDTDEIATERSSTADDDMRDKLLVRSAAPARPAARAPERPSDGCHAAERG